MTQRFLLVLVAAAAVACGGDPLTDVSGQWDLEETVMSQTGISCTATGDLLLSQSSNGNMFTGQRSRTGTCTGAPQGFSIDGAAGVLGGEVNGATVTAEIDFCDYTGTLTTSDEINGTFECPDGISQQNILFTGTWKAVR